MIDLRQTFNYARYMDKIGWQVDKSQGFYAYVKKVSLIGNLIKVQRPENFDSNKIRNLVSKYKPFQIVIEPKYQSHTPHLATHNFRQSRTYFIPSKTIQIDLTKPEEKLLKEMHHKTRYNIKKFSQSLNTSHRSNDIESFAFFWQDCALKQRGMFLSQKKEVQEIFRTFAKNAKLILVSKNSELLAGILMICTSDTAYYMFAASNAKGKKMHAPTLAAWNAITLAKKMGKKIFDFEGIYDERFPLKTWLGFTRFKMSFGGKVVDYPGTFSKFRLPI